MSEKQPIHGYVCAQVHGSFEAYRRELGLTSASALMTLLVLREIKLERLARVAGRGRIGQPRHDKISAYVDPDKAEAFKTLTERLGRSISDCTADLAERELEERWLESVLEARCAADEAP